MKSGNKIIAVVTIMLFIFSFGFALLTTGLHITFAEITEVEVGINGLSCPFCVVQLEKPMERIKAIDRLDIHLKKGIACFTLKENSLLNIKEIKDAVKKTGFSVRNIKLKVIGEIVTYGEFPALKASGTGQVFVLDDLKGKQPGSIVMIEGNVHEHAQGNYYGLSIERIENVKK